MVQELARLDTQNWQVNSRTFLQMILGGAKKSEKQHRDIFKIHICCKAMLDFNFKLK